MQPLLFVQLAGLLLSALLQVHLEVQVLLLFLMSLRFLGRVRCLVNRMLGDSELKLLLLKFLNSVGLALSLLAGLPAEVHQEHPETLRDCLRANLID